VEPQGSNQAVCCATVGIDGLLDDSRLVSERNQKFQSNLYGFLALFPFCPFTEDRNSRFIAENRELFEIDSGSILKPKRLLRFSVYSDVRMAAIWTVSVGFLSDFHCEVTFSFRRFISSPFPRKVGTEGSAHFLRWIDAWPDVILSYFWSTTGHNLPKTGKSFFP
jgi:hypothetical protein